MRWGKEALIGPMRARLGRWRGTATLAAAAAAGWALAIWLAALLVSLLAVLAGVTLVIGIGAVAAVAGAQRIFRMRQRRPTVIEVLPPDRREPAAVAEVTPTRGA